MRRLIECCWQENPVLRPSFREIVAALQHIIVETAIEDEIGRRIWKERFLNLVCSTSIILLLLSLLPFLDLIVFFFFLGETKGMGVMGSVLGEFL